MLMANSNSKSVCVVDGSQFSTLVEAAAEFTRALGLTTPWNGNLDAFNDFLRGGFGTPHQGQGFVLVWLHSEVSRQRLGYGETLRWLEENVQYCHPSNIAEIQSRIVGARRYEGETLFDTLVSIIRDHEDVELRLE